MLDKVYILWYIIRGLKNNAQKKYYIVSQRLTEKRKK